MWYLFGAHDLVEKVVYAVADCADGLDAVAPQEILTELSDCPHPLSLPLPV